MPDQHRIALVEGLSFRSYKNQPSTQTDYLILHSPIGIFGDCHANPLSPRQVLIAFTTDYREFALPEGSLKENILLNVNPSFSEKFESGDCLSVGDVGFKLRITFKCEPCGRLNKVHPNLSREIRGRRGFLARVVRSGELRTGDILRLTKNVYPPFSDDWHQRVIAIARLLPANRSMSYSTLAVLSGVASAYCRAFPRLLRTHRLPTERILPSASSSQFPQWDAKEIFAQEDEDCGTESLAATYCDTAKD